MGLPIIVNIFLFYIMDVYVIIDNDGVIGVMSDEHDAIDYVTKYSDNVLTYLKYTVEDTSDIVYILVYVNTSNIACITTSADRYNSMQTTLLKLGMVNPEPIELWTYKVNEISSAMKKRSNEININKLIEFMDIY